MARSNTDVKCKQCRREQMKLYLKGARCFSKCPLDRENSAANPPGMHGARKSKQSEYGRRLREKQRLKRFYGVLERQFRRYYALATRSPENTGEQLLSILERRLDNVIHRLGIAPNRNGARQMVAHGHVLLNGRKCDIPSMLVKPGDLIKVKTRDRSLKLARLSLQGQLGVTARVPDFLELTNNGDEPEGRMTRLPNRSDVDERIAEIQEQLIIEIATR
jgi:small subunit ribosomal protein S4